jgi:hypothetical protein
MESKNHPTRLAEIVRKALSDSGFRLALESGSVCAASLQLSPVELDSVSEVLRRYKGAVSKKVLPEIVAWRDDS